MSFSEPRPSTSRASTCAEVVYPAESLDQLFTRVSARSRPPLANLEPILFGSSAGPKAREIIEITGESNVGKTHLLMELIARATLPVRYGGCEAEAVLIDTDHHFQIFKLAAMLEKHLLNASTANDSTATLDDDQTRCVIEASLKRCHLLKCHSPEQLQLAILGLDRMFRQNGEIALLAFDSVSTFYWLERNEAKPMRMDTYAKMLVGKLANATKHHGVVLVYVRPSSFRSNKEPLGGPSSTVAPVRPYPVNYCIRMESGKRVEPTESPDEETRALFVCHIQDGRGTVLRDCAYIIDRFGIEWEHIPAIVQTKNSE